MCDVFFICVLAFDNPHYTDMEGNNTDFILKFFIRFSVTTVIEKTEP